MKILGLQVILDSLPGDALKRPTAWGIKAVKKDQLLKQTPANSKKKAHRRAVEASRRGNR